MPLNLSQIRSQFPALARETNGRPVAYFDGPAGTQVPQSVADAVAECLLHHNANSGAPFATSREADAILDGGRTAAADLLGAADPDEIAFGPNMTTLTLAASRAIGRTWRPGDEIIVSRLDHDANVTPWVLAARDAGATVRHIGINPHDCTLDLGSFEAALSERTKLVAVGYASNASGTINPVAHIVARAKAVGALTWIDAVHYAPHGLIDVQAAGCDFLVCSGYKFFGPHVGILWGRRALLESMEPYKLRPSSNDLPGRWMTGTQNHEGIAGVTAAVDYMAGIGVLSASHSVAPSPRLSPPRGVGSESSAAFGGEGGNNSRRERLRRAFAKIVAHERELGARLIVGLQRFPGLKIWGITHPGHLHERVPTVSVTHVHKSPREISEALAQRGLYTWAGNHYALPFTETLGLEPHGTLRIGLVHYNTADEVDRLLAALAEIV
ncbi:MAG: cysteine desulfurase-like protein [Planctomycetaceae bacterium]|nr:cysteine desulfurase-like protein [Planctomycetaceae bacterium]